MLNSRIKPFELSLWKDELTLVPGNSPTYLDIYKGINTDQEDLSFWYFPRKWTETTLAPYNNSNAATVSLGGNNGATQNIESNLSTTTINFKPNTNYSIFVELKFSDSNLPNWADYISINPNSENCKMINLTKRIGDNNYNTFRTIFDSDIAISFNDRGFNLNDSILRGKDAAVLYQKNETENGKNITRVYCICSLKTNDFLKEQNTIGLWTTFNCFKTGKWSGIIEIQVIEGDDFYKQTLHKNDNKVLNNDYLERLRLKSNEVGRTTKSSKGLFFKVNNKANESILYIFQKKIREEIGIQKDSSNYNITDNGIINHISNNIFNDFFEEIRATCEKHNGSFLSTNFYTDIYGVFNKYFPFIPIYSTSSKSAFSLIKKLKDKNNNDEVKPFEKFLTVNSSDASNFLKIITNNATSWDDKQWDDKQNDLKNAIGEYIYAILENSYISANINTNSSYEYLLLQLIVFYLNNNSTIRYIHNLIYEEAEKYCKSESLELATMNMLNISVYVIALLLVVDVVNSNTTPYKGTESTNFSRNVEDVLSNMVQVTLNPLSYTNRFEVTGNFNIGHRATYILKRIMYMGWTRFGYYNSLDQNFNKIPGFLLWLNDETFTVDEETININNSIDFYDIIKLLGQHLVLNNGFVKIPSNKIEEAEYYLKDKKMFIIGADTFNEKQAAQNIQLKRSIKDVTTLTFSLYDRYFDRDAQAFVENPYIPYLKNESKLRLFYDNEWYDFTITNIQENRMVEHKIDYTAKDSNVLELSKIGFNKTFNTELDNNIGNINELTQKTIDGLNWLLDEEKTEKIQQWTEQPIFYGYLKKSLNVKDMTGSSITLSRNSLVFLFYNEVLNEEKELTILTLQESEIGSSIEELIDMNSINNVLDTVNYYKLDTTTLLDFEYVSLKNVFYKKPNFIAPNLYLLFSTRAKQLICKPKMHYSKPLNRYVYEYKYINEEDSDDSNNNKIYYGYEQHEYSTDSLIINLLPHGQDFIDLNNWYVSNSIDSITKTIKSSLDLCITNEDIETQESEGQTTEIEIIDGNYSFLTFKTENNYLKSGSSAEYNNPHGFIFNTDLTYNFDKLNSLKVNDEFVLRLQLERGIDKSLSSSGESPYTDDQITLLESLIPCIYSYTSVNKVQSLGLSAATEQDQLIYFWYPTQRNVGGKQILNLTQRASDGCLIPVYWGSYEAGAGDVIKKGLPVFYTYENKLSDSNWYNKNNPNSGLLKTDTSGSTIKNKKYYLTTRGRSELCRFIIRELTHYTTSSDSVFQYYHFPIVSSIFKRENLLKLITDDQITTADQHKDDAAASDQVKNPWNHIDIFKNEYNDITKEDKYIWWSNQITDSIKYYITFNLNLLTYYHQCFKPENQDDIDKREALEQYLYNADTNCFEPINITIEGLNSGEKTAPGLPLETNQFYNDFEIIMRGRAVWKPVKYSPFGTCIFETVGKYYGAPKYINNSYSYQPINYEYGDLLSKNIGLFFLIRPTMYDGNLGSSQLAVSKVELFRKYEDENGQIISPSDIIKANVKTIYSLYDPALVQNKTALKENDIQWHSQKYYLEEKYKKVIDESGEKINSITMTESNVYNILQKLAEIFNAWLHIEVKHDQRTGETVGIITDTSGNLNKKPIKTVYFTNADYNNNENHAGIKYKINLKNIQRQIDSNDIINKLIVKNNNNEYGKLGFCSIMNSSLNISGSNNIFNFDYYINNGILKEEDIYHLLYNIIYPRTHIIGQSLLKISKNKNEIKIKINQAQADTDFYKVGCDNIEAQISSYTADFYEITGIDYSLYVANPNTSNSNHPLYIYRNNMQILGYIRKLEYYTKLLVTYRNHLTSAERILEQLQEQYTQYDQQMTGLTYQRDYLLKQFYDVYDSYIKEGSWISEDYIDDDLYYLDSEKKLEESSKPKVTYNIEVVDVSNLPDFSDYTFNLYEKTYIEDPEIFGYNKNGTPYKEEITVSELTNYLQSPDKNTITVQNYKTKFDDLFQRMSSTIQAVELGTGNYTNTNNSLLKNRILNNDI